MIELILLICVIWFTVAMLRGIGADTTRIASLVNKSANDHRMARMIAEENERVRHGLPMAREPGMKYGWQVLLACVVIWLGACAWLDSFGANERRIESVKQEAQAADIQTAPVDWQAAQQEQQASAQARYDDRQAAPAANADWREQMLDCGGGEEFVFVASSLWAWNASIDAAVAGDRYGWTEMIFSGDLLVVPRYTRCRILDAGFTVSKIRLKDGPYPNQLAWVAPEWLHDPIPEQTAVDYAEMAGNEKSSGGTGLANAAAPEGEACAECSDEVLVAAGAEQEPEGILQKTAGATASLVAKTTDKAITDSKQLAPPQKEEVSAPALAPVGELTPVELVRVIDGDTIVVLRAGEEETVRLFGADCPEEGEDGFNASRAFTLGALSKVRQLYLEFDAVAEYDSYQRTLAWFWLEYKSGTRKLLNIELVHAGYASWETGTQSARYLP